LNIKTRTRSLHYLTELHSDKPIFTVWPDRDSSGQANFSNAVAVPGHYNREGKLSQPLDITTERLLLKRPTFCLNAAVFIVERSFRVC